MKGSRVLLCALLGFGQKHPSMVDFHEETKKTTPMPKRKSVITKKLERFTKLEVANTMLKGVTFLPQSNFQQSKKPQGN
jgi:hypothetical protein